MYSVELKVKRKELAQECRIIRAEERRAKAEKRTTRLNELHFHRVGVVRPAARAAELAHAYLRGYPYLLVERTARSRPPIDEVRKLVSKYGKSNLEAKELHKALVLWAVVSETGEASNPPRAGSTPVAASN